MQLTTESVPKAQGTKEVDGTTLCLLTSAALEFH
jgi:hypothetical protein